MCEGFRSAFVKGGGPYRVEFPYTCTCSIPEDGHITKVTLETRSEELRYGKNEEDIRLQKSVESADAMKTESKGTRGYLSGNSPAR